MDSGVDFVDIKTGRELCAGGLLDAVDGPEGAGIAVPCGSGVRDEGRADEGLRRGGVVRGEGYVGGRVPVLCGDFECEGECEERIDWGDYIATRGDGESTSLRGGKRSDGTGEGRGTGGQKSSCRSTTRSAGLKGVGVDILAMDGLGASYDAMGGGAYSGGGLALPA